MIQNNNKFSQCAEVIEHQEEEFNPYLIRLQSEEIPMESAGEVALTKTETVTFVDATLGDVDIIERANNPIAMADATTDISLQQFLSRPIEIDQRFWSTSDVIGPVGALISPWYSYLNNTAVKNKLANFAFIRATLNVKTVINGTPFHYGNFRVCYEPSVASDNTGYRTSKIRAPPSGTNNKISLSQLPGYCLDPAGNSGGELKVPMFLHKNWANLNSASEIYRLGRLTYYAYTPLSVASATASSSVAMTTYAWLEDVHLMGSTSSALLQGDEYDGKVSKPASAVSRIASMLTNVPVIGPFARATSIGAGAVASIAHLFGFTNVPNIDTVAAFVPTAGPHLATSEISVPHQKLTLDPKQELSIDPRIHNIGSEDELVLKHILSKPSVLDVFTWQTSTTTGTVLMNALVGPALFGRNILQDSVPTTRGYRVYHTPMSYVSALFKHWRGDIIFSFNIVCSKFHKGRLRVTWDPFGGIATSVPDENTVYTTIIDIGATNNVEFRVPYHQGIAWLVCRGVGQVNYTAGTSLTVDNRFDNGMIALSVLNPLVSPITPSSVYIVTSVRAAENFEFANPSEGLSADTAEPSYFPLQGDSYEIKPQEMPLGDTGATHDERYGLNFGEAIPSLRMLMHRQCLSETISAFRSSTTWGAWWRKSFSRLPGSFGYDPSSARVANNILAAGTSPFNWFHTTPLAYISWMYGGHRGSTNYTLTAGTDLFPSVSHITVQRFTASALASSKYTSTNTQNGGATSSARTRFLNAYQSAGNAGVATTHLLTNGSLQFQFPDYNSTNFAYPDPTYWVNGNVFDQTDQQSVAVDALIKQANTYIANNVPTVGDGSGQPLENFTMNVYCGSGPDFQVLWWLCCPTLDYPLSLPSVS